MAARAVLAAAAAVVQEQLVVQELAGKEPTAVLTAVLKAMRQVEAVQQRRLQTVQILVEVRAALVQARIHLGVLQHLLDKISQELIGTQVVAVEAVSIPQVA